MRARIDKLVAAGAVVELTEKRARTLSQNAYLHVCIAYLAACIGETAEYVKRNYFKLHCNRELFLRSRYDERLRREVHYLRSSRDLTKEEMSLAIERFRTWSEQECGEYIPSSDEHEYILKMENEIERSKKYI